MHYTELAKELKNKNPEYSNRNDKELVESYLKRYPEEKGLIDFTDDNKLLNVGRSIGQGATFGQGSHIAGIGEGVGSMAYNIVNPIRKSIDNISQFKNPLTPLKEIKQAVSDDYTEDYKKGREDFKKEYKEFEDKNKVLALGGDLLGGIATGGFGAKAITKVPRLAAILNSSKLLQSPITKAALVGGAFGGGYGASNTLGKGFDFGNSIIGAGTGALGGAALGGIGKLVGKTAQKLLGGKEKALLEGGEKVAQLEGKEAPQLTNAEKILLKEGEIPKNVIDVTPSQELKTNLLPKTEETKVLSSKNPFGTGYFMDGIDILVPEGMENKNFRAFLKSPLIQEEARKGLIGRKWETYQNQAADEFRKMNKEIKKVVDNAYKIIPDDTIIPMKKGEENLMYQLANELSALSNKTVIKKQTNAIKEASDLLGRIENASNNETSLTFGNVKDLTDELWSLSQKYEKRNNPHAADMFKKMYNHMRTFRDTNPEVKKATELYKDFKEINKTLGEIGFDVEKASNNNNIGTRIQVHGRGRKEEILNRALDKVAQILNRHSDNPELAQFQTLRDKVNLAQVSYDARPTDNSKLLNAFSFLRPIQTLRNISDRYTNPQAQEQLKVLAARIKTGKVNPKDFENIEILRGGDYANRNYYRKKAYGDVLETLKSNLLNKEVIEGGGK